MLLPLLIVSALIGLMPGVDGKIEHINISSCPFSYYGKTYQDIYVNVTTGDNPTICFSGYFNPLNPGDCIIGPTAQSDSLNKMSGQYSSSELALVRKNVATVTSNLTCYTQISLFYNDNVRVNLYKMETEAVVYLYNEGSGNYIFNLTVNGTVMDTLNVSSTLYKDISSCRQGGVIYSTGKVLMTVPDICMSHICNDVAVIQQIQCGDQEYCQGDGRCIIHHSCTVTGPTLIDFNNNVGFFNDRCAYDLLSGSSLSGLSIWADFQDRRRKDVSLLDSVTLSVSGADIHLEQDGRVLLNNTLLTLNSSTQTFQGVELSKGPTGVIAKYSVANLTVSVFFDGNTAQLHLNGPGGENITVDGLCSNTNRTLTDMKRPKDSASGCDTAYKDTADSTIKCPLMTERCNLLNQAPFNACHNYTDPQPYFTACNDTLCKYPAVDGLDCQFLKTYARACNLLKNNTVDNWWGGANCSAPRALCQENSCSANEFCGEDANGEPACLCRAISAAPYRSTDSLGDPTVCGQDSASVTLVGCLLREKGINSSALSLNDQNCTGQINELNGTVTFSYNSSNTCGTVVTTNNSHVVYKNTIVSQNSSGTITRHEQVFIDFSCFFVQPENQTLSFKIKHSSVVKHIISGSWNYTLTMGAFTDAGLTQAMNSSIEVSLNQKIWVELKTVGLEGGFVNVVTDSCWATNKASANSAPRYDLIVNGCPSSSDDSVEVMGNGQGTSNSFAFRMFQFTRSNSEVFLHCKIHLCSENCTQKCNGSFRRRRSAALKYLDDAPAFISMSWTE